MKQILNLKIIYVKKKFDYKPKKDMELNSIKMLKHEAPHTSFTSSVTYIVGSWCVVQLGGPVLAATG